MCSHLSGFRNTVCLSLMSFMIVGCSGRNAPFFEHVTTSMNVTIRNHSSTPLLAKSHVQQKYDANYCKPDFANENSAVLNPGETTTVSVSIECNMKVNTTFSVFKDTGYSMAALSTKKAANVAKIVPGVQFLAYFRDSPIPMTVTVVNPPLVTAGYSYVWPLAPNGAQFVAWIEKIDKPNDSSYWLLRFSLPQGTEKRDTYVEFDPMMGFDLFGESHTLETNGTKRDLVFRSIGPSVSSAISEGTVTCDDVGCIESQ
jgi:hypothetical protein